MKNAILHLLKTPEKCNRLVVAPSGKMGEFDSHATDCPFLFFHNNYYWMTFVGWDGIGYQTGLARSSNLLTWEKVGLILGRGPAGTVTEYNIALTSIMRNNALFGSGSLKQHNGYFVGTWHAYPGQGYEEGPAVIGLCFSKDLRNWEISEPVIRPEAANSWEAGGLYKSWLMENAGTYYLFYNAKNIALPGDHWIEQTGVAVSRDLVHWEKHPANPILSNGPCGTFDDIFASDPSVLYHDGQWIMFYFGFSTDGHARNSVAFSSDLIEWKKSNQILIDIGAPGSIDSKYAHKPAIIAKDKCLYHFYCAVSPASENRNKDINYGEIRGITLAHNAAS